MTPTAAPRHGSSDGLARIIAFRPRGARSFTLHDADGQVEPARPLITWATRGELMEHAAYREVPSGRTGWFLGAVPVPALERLELGDTILIFRSRDDGQLFSYSMYDALRGIAFETVE